MVHKNVSGHFAVTYNHETEKYPRWKLLEFYVFSPQPKQIIPSKTITAKILTFEK